VHVNRHQDWDEAPNVSTFVGREAELAQLQAWILDEDCRLVAVSGMGGIGKTVLAAKLAEQVQEPFEFIAWRSLRNAPPLEQIISDWLQLFALGQSVDQQASFEAKLATVMAHLQNHRCLLILDNCESILASHDLSGNYREGYQNYGDLLRRISTENHQSCVVITGRELPSSLTLLEKGPWRSLVLKGLADQEWQTILQRIGISPASDQVAHQLLERYDGNPLALNIVAAAIQELFGGNVALFLEQAPVLFGSVYDLLAQQFNRLSALEQSVMYWLAINREWVSLAQLSEDLWPRVAQRLVIDALLSLQRRSLIEANTGQFTLQPVVMESVTEQLLEQAEQDILTGEFDLLNHHALIKAQAIDYIRESQVRVILNPLLEQLQAKSTSEQSLVQKLQERLQQLQATGSEGYSAGNLLNLLRQLGTDLTGYDFSRLTIWQAYLSDVNLQRVNLWGANLERTVFAEKLGVPVSVAFSPDGELLAVGDNHGEAGIWQFATGKKLYVLTGPGWINDVHFSPDGQYLVSAHSDLALRIWDMATQQLWQTLTGHDFMCKQTVFSTDSHTLWSGNFDGTLKAWNVQTGQCWLTIVAHTKEIYTLAVHPTAAVIATGSGDMTIKLWDMQTGACLNTLAGHTDEIWGLVFARSAANPDEIELISGSCDQTIKFWNLTTGECSFTLEGHRDRILCVSVNATGQILAAGHGDGMITLWDRFTGVCLMTLQGHAGSVHSLSFHPKTSTLVSSSFDGLLKLWDVNFPESANSANFQSTSPSLVLRGHPGQCLKTSYSHTSAVWCLAFSPDGKVLASGGDDQLIHCWDSVSGKHLHRFTGHTGSVWCLNFAPNPNSENQPQAGPLLTSGSNDGTLRLWDMQTGQSRILSRVAFLQRTPIFSPDGKRVVTWGFDDTIQFWEIATGKMVKSFPGGSCNLFTARFSPDGQILVSNNNSGGESRALAWQISTGECIHSFTGHTGAVYDIAMHPQGEKIATSGADHMVKLWSLQTGECLLDLVGHQGQILSIAFVPPVPDHPVTSQLLASGSFDHTVKLWNIETGECVRTLTGHTAEVRAVALTILPGTSPTEGKLILASGSMDETVRIWDPLTGECLHVLRAPRPYEGMDITEVTGLTEAQKASLRFLGAVEDGNAQP
jgi:WD40 repeat protein